MAQRNYEELLPLQPGDKAKAWARRVSKCDEEHLLLYKQGYSRDPLTGQRHKVAELSCSACGRIIQATKVGVECCMNAYTPAPFGWMHPETNEPVISGKESTCPHCGAKVDVSFLRDGRKADWNLKEYWFMTVERVGELLCLIGWLMKKEVIRDRETDRLREQLRFLPYQAYVFEEKKTVFLRGYDKYFSQIHFHEEWEQKDRCLDEYGKVGTCGMAPWDKRMLIGSSCENSKLDLYLKITKGDALPVTYLRLWQKRKAVENLVMQGAGTLLHELMERESRRTYAGWCSGIPKLERINWKEKRPAQMLGLTKEEFCHCVDDKWDSEAWWFYLKQKKAGEKLKLPEDMRLCCKVGLYGLDGVREKYGSLMPAVRYLAKQGNSATYLLDYWNMAETEGYDLNLRHVRWPKDLKIAHDRVLREQIERRAREKDEAEKKKNAALVERFADVAEKLKWTAVEMDGICIRVAAAPEELDKEGKTLSHCVATYKEKHARGDSAIFFVREVSSPEEPWYTLELDLSNGENPRVIQNRGKYNCWRTPAVQEFEDKWLEFVKANWAAHNTKKKRRETA